MSNINLAEHQQAVAHSLTIEINFGIFPQINHVGEKNPDQQGHIFDQLGISVEQQLISNNPLRNYAAWKLKDQENDDLLVDSVSFVNDIMKIMEENPKLYNALANDKYD
jgi:hypothetical protein